MGEISAYMSTCRQDYLRNLPFACFLLPGPLPQVSQDSFLSRETHTALKLLLLLSPAVVKKKKSEHRFLGFPIGAVLKTLHFCCRGCAFHPESGIKNLQTEKQNRGIPCILTGNQRETPRYILLFSLSHPPPAHPFLLTVFLQAVGVGAPSRGQEGNRHIQV